MSIGKHERPNKGATDVWLTPLEIIRQFGTFDLDPLPNKRAREEGERWCPKYVSTVWS